MTWPTTSAGTTHLDDDADSPLSARPDLLQAVQNVNAIKDHVSAFAQTLLDDADAATARATLGAAATGSGLSQFAATSSDNLRGVISDETGTGALVFANSPTLTTPNIGAATGTSLSLSGNATLGDAEATDTHAIKGATTLLANSASAALTITQTGAGNAFVVEDSASTDSTPFVIDANGRVLIGTTTNITSNQLQIYDTTDYTPQQSLIHNGNTAGSAAYLRFDRRRTAGGVVNGDTLGTVVFQGYGVSDYSVAALISASVDGEPSTAGDTTDMPGRLVFSTTADGASSPTERMRITSAGDVGIGGAPAVSGLDIVKTSGQIRLYDGTVDSRTYMTAGSVVVGAQSNHSLVLITNGTGKVTIGTDGSASISGLVNISGASAGQIKFPAAQNASADANTLDDYEEGTFTPVVRDAAAGNAATAATALGTYTKVGRLVTCSITLTDINTTGLTAGNQAWISGLPFVANATANYLANTSVMHASTTATTGSVSAYVTSGNTALQLRNDTTTGGATFLVSGLTSGSADLWATITYQA